MDGRTAPHSMAMDTLGGGGGGGGGGGEGGGRGGSTNVRRIRTQ